MAPPKIILEPRLCLWCQALLVRSRCASPSQYRARKFCHQTCKESYLRAEIRATTHSCRDCAVLLNGENWPDSPTKRLNRGHICTSCNNRRGYEWGKANKAAMVKTRKQRRHRLRARVLEAYGGKCACCGESTPEFLGVDHIYGGGTQERIKDYSNGTTFYAYLSRTGFPRDKYQLLCHNCNMAKGFYGQCPHERL